MTESSRLSRTPPLVELRYFAAPRDDWELLLLRAHQLGASTVAARVPWAWHAFAPGMLDFDGTTDERRDLVGLVRLCGQLGLRVLLDPGPLHSDLLGGGAPAWLLQQHPAAHARGPDGAPWLDSGGLPHPSASHPEFLAAARGWIAAFSAAMRALQAPAGPIAALYAGTSGQANDSYAGASSEDRPALRSEALGGSVASDHESSVAATHDWLRAEGWSVPLRRGDLFRRPPSGLAEPILDLGSAVLLELPSRTGHPLLGAAAATIDWLLRSDGSARPDFWRVKLGSLLSAIAGADGVGAGGRADLALADARAARHPDQARAAISRLERRLRQASVAFARLDLDAVTPQDLARYTLIVLPEGLALQPATQLTLTQCANVVLLSDQAAPLAYDIKDADELAHSPMRPLGHSTMLPTDISADELAALIEQRGGVARYAWADGANVDLIVNYGAAHTYLSIDNRHPAPYNGILAYRGRDGAVLHLHAGIGAERTGMVLLTDDEVYGAAIDGDGAEGGWLARGLRSSAVYNAGAGALARCGEGLLLTAPQSGRFQARRAEGWAHMRAHRLLLSGALLAARAQVDATHISVAYVAEDARGQTDMYIVLPDGAAPPLVRSYLANLLAARAARLRRAATLAGDAHGQPEIFDTFYLRAAEPLRSAAAQLEAAAEQFDTLDAYSAAWSAADELCLSAHIALTHTLTRAHGALLAGNLNPTAHTLLQQQIARIIDIGALGN